MQMQEETDGKTAVMWAVLNGHFDILGFLIRNDTLERLRQEGTQSLKPEIRALLRTRHEYVKSIGV
ncbi:MAG: hypothetical protein ACP5SA_03535 [Candidatus Micrarchaeia archaeon]